MLSISRLSSRGSRGALQRTLPKLLVQRRLIAGGVLRSLTRLTRLRYIVLGGAVGGGATLHNKYEDWKDNLPDAKWLRDYLPSSDEVAQRFRRAREQAASFSQRLSLPDKTWIPESLREADPAGKLDQFRQWLASGIPDRASEIVAAIDDDEQRVASSRNVLSTAASPSASSSAQSANGEREAKVSEMQEELIKNQIQYQKDIEKLEREIRELRRQLLLKSQATSSATQRKTMKRSLIDMYSEVLDELCIYDATYNMQDHLPRVVVVGDQSSGKTSVLEMVVQARIFPRGSGEMMTRSPVKVTLSEGPFHIAQFKDGNREFDLTKEQDLSALRKEIEVRMKNSVGRGQTISTEVISLTVKGPGLQRMVLIDLPGIISTVTSGMASDTKESIHRLVRNYMENPNAIILCIQDGSLDAERSNVTDLVSTMDPDGKRTIFVLTKVDVAETSLYDPARIKKALEGKLFPMKALGYFAVVTGKGNSNDSISDIKQYEEEFFKSSKLFKDCALKTTQMTTRNLSLAVSDRFWKMVKDSVEQQADSFRAKRFNLEAEWKNTHPGVRELDRVELFEKAKGEILDELINLSQVSAKEWEDAFMKKLWDKTSEYVIESVYLPAAQTDSSITFNTAVDIKLRQWADQVLPRQCVEIGMETLKEKFIQLLKHKKDGDEIFENLKTVVVTDIFRQHQWDSKAEDSLRVLQQMSLEDRAVHDKGQWESAVNFMENQLREMHDTTHKRIQELNGPGLVEQWTHWRRRTPEHSSRASTAQELERLFKNGSKRHAVLSADDLTAVRKNLQAANVDVSDDFIRDTWHVVYRKKFLDEAIATASVCRKAFYYYQKGYTDTGIECNDIVLFWRIQRMLQATSNALRQQVVNNEARRLEKILKDILEEYGEDRHKLEALITGKRVELAEELKKVRLIQEKLEEFILALNKDKS